MSSQDAKERGDRGSYTYDLDLQMETHIDLYEKDREAFWTGEDAPIELGRSAVQFRVAEELAAIVVRATECLVQGDESKRSLKAVRDRLAPFVANLVCNTKLAAIVWARMTEKGGGSADVQGIEHMFQEEVLHLIDKDSSVMQGALNDSRLLACERPEEDSLAKLIWERLCINLAWEAGATIPRAANRLVLLSRLVADADPSPPTMAFLRRVSRCFIQGFDPECIILCRSVLDTAFRDFVPDQTCEEVCGSQGDRGWGLAARIKTAYRKGMLSEAGKKAAFSVKDRGDKAVHYDPHATGDVVGTIRHTLVVLGQIAGSGRNAGQTGH